MLTQIPEPRKQGIPYFGAYSSKARAHRAKRKLSLQSFGTEDTHDPQDEPSPSPQDRAALRRNWAAEIFPPRTKSPREGQFVGVPGQHKDDPSGRVRSLSGTARRTPLTLLSGSRMSFLTLRGRRRRTGRDPQPRSLLVWARTSSRMSSPNRATFAGPSPGIRSSSARLWGSVLSISSITLRGNTM